MIPRMKPCFVDMGTLSMHLTVRYDACNQRYDLQDLLDLACGNKLATATAARMAVLRRTELFALRSCTESPYGIVKWLGNSGAEVSRQWKRETVKAAAATTLLRETPDTIDGWCSHRARLERVARWIENNPEDALKFLPLVLASDDCQEMTSI